MTALQITAIVLYLFVGCCTVIAASRFNVLGDGRRDADYSRAASVVLVWPGVWAMYGAFIFLRFLMKLGKR